MKNPNKLKKKMASRQFITKVRILSNKKNILMAFIVMITKQLSETYIPFLISSYDYVREIL